MFKNTEVHLGNDFTVLGQEWQGGRDTGRNKTEDEAEALDGEPCLLS